jgi:hypothetical protein
MKYNYQENQNKFKLKEDKLLLKKGNAILGFTGKNKQGHYFAFGKPSQSEMLLFYCDSEESAIKELVKNTSVTF